MVLLPPIEPMLARLMREIPEGDWAYEPKWDGFRCLLFRVGNTVVLQSRNLRPLDRYFPEVIAAAESLPTGVVLDGEVLLQGDDTSFAMLLERIHPAKSRVTSLAAEHPATYAAFDCLQVGGVELVDRPFRDRRAALEHLVTGETAIRLTPLTYDIAKASQWWTSRGVIGTGSSRKTRVRRTRPASASW